MIDAIQLVIGSAGSGSSLGSCRQSKPSPAVIGVLNSVDGAEVVAAPGERRATTSRSTPIA